MAFRLPGSHNSSRGPTSMSYKANPANVSDRADASNVAHRDRVRHGRSGPRSRFGCVTCKQRRVRCDESQPVCASCTRLRLNCVYGGKHVSQPPQMSKLSGLARHSTASSKPERPEAVDPQASYSMLVDAPAGGTALQSLAEPWSRPMSGSNTQVNLPFWKDTPRLNLDCFEPGPGTSWAGDWPCIFPDDPALTEPAMPTDDNDYAALYDPHFASNAGDVTQPSVELSRWSGPAIATVASGLPNPDILQEQEPPWQANHLQISFTPTTSEAEDDISQGKHLKTLFLKIAQPPASVLIGGFKRWRSLQRHFCKLSDQSQAVENALLCVIELLTINDAVEERRQPRDECMRRILHRHRSSCVEIRAKLSKSAEVKSKVRETLLAAIFLLAWFEVINDQDTSRGLFPRDLADAVIISSQPWTRTSQDLLSWLNTLDSKATHLGGDNLLSQKSLEVVSRYPMRIASTNIPEHEDGDRIPQDSESELSEASPSGTLTSKLNQNDLRSGGAMAPSTGTVKQTILQTILQPALEWYLTSQSYCRRISSHNKHHCKRETSEDEYRVVTACKQLETELVDLWNFRPLVISLTAEDLRPIVSSDLAVRLEEIFNVYLASFWILFVYLHRVSWWNFSHSETTRHALTQVWTNLQRAYGEVSEETQKKVVHPALLWPLFMFGCECKIETQRAWAIGQLEALGEAKPILATDDAHGDSLPPFKLSAGATRNAKRASVLLKELIKQQDAQNIRVDDRDLSLKMFNCYFSIV